MPEKNETIIYTTPDGKETFEVNLKKDIIKQIIANEYAKNVSMSKRLRGR